jgi:hypothetical protein
MGDAVLVQRDQIQIALNNEHRSRRPAGILGPIQTIKHPALGVNERLRGIQILRG